MHTSFPVHREAANVCGTKRPRFSNARCLRQRFRRARKSRYINDPLLRGGGFGDAGVSNFGTRASAILDASASDIGRERQRYWARAPAILGASASDIGRERQRRADLGGVG